MVKKEESPLNPRSSMLLSGSGESTLSRHLIGLKTPARGEVFCDGVNFWEADPAERDRLMRGVGILYQIGELWSSLTLSENVTLPLGLYMDLSQQIAVEIKTLLA